MERKMKKKKRKKIFALLLLPERPSKCIKDLWMHKIMHVTVVLKENTNNNNNNDNEKI